jgi:hypothetical protein
VIKNPKISDFPVSSIKTGDIVLEYISWDNIKKVMGKRLYRKFMEFMHGQTCIRKGVYPCDIENFLRPPDRRFFD